MRLSMKDLEEFAETLNVEGGIKLGVRCQNGQYNIVSVYDSGMYKSLSDWCSLREAWQFLRGYNCAVQDTI